jgi:hypothetical protein
MRTGKRALAGVAAGALALGALTIASAPAASAKPSIKPKASVTATVNAVRSSGTGATLIQLPAATLTWSGAKTISSTSTVDLLSAPTATAKLYYNSGASADDTTQLDDNGVAGGAVVDNATYSTDDSMFSFRVDTAGSYVGQIYNGVDTVSFSFATAGAPTSMKLEPATQTVLVGAQADLSLTLLDAAGKATQPQNVDSVALTRSPTDDTIVLIDDTVAPAAVTVLTGLTGSAPALGNLSTGTGYFSLNTNPTSAGTTTVTATPLGTLPGTGVTTQTASVVKSGTVASVAVANISVTLPANAFNSWKATDGINWTGRLAQVPEGTTSMTITVDDTAAAAAGNKIRLEVDADQGTVNGATAAQYIDLTTDANKRATTTVTLGGLAVTNNTIVTVNQVNVADQQVNFASTQNVRLPITVLTPQVAAYTTTVTPAALVAKIGASVPQVVNVDDSFGTPQAGWVVQVYRGATVSGGTFLGQASTNAAGDASVSVTNASTVTTTTTESYSYKITGPGGATFNDEAAATVTYTTSGNITSLSVTPGGGTPCSTTSCTVTNYGAVRVASSGVIAAPANVSTATQAVSTDVITRGNGSNMITLTIGTTPTSAAVVTVPEGVKVSKDAPNGATTLWSAGAQTATVSGTAYIWATKTGLHDIKVDAGGLSVTVKIRVYNIGGDAYNIALSPAKQDVNVGSIDTATLKVTDIFGNPVQTGTADDSGPVSISAAGGILLAGFNTTNTYTTNASGEATVTFIAGNAAAAGTLTAIPTTGTTTAAWVTGYTKPVGAPAPVTSAVAEVTVGAAPVTKSITITGSRTTVGGKPGIEVDGITVGFENGKTVIPYFRFPGETTYTEGTARPVITDDAFMWQRKTGKKFYAYVTSDDGAVQSNRVIIDAN